MAIVADAGALIAVDRAIGGLAARPRAVVEEPGSRHVPAHDH